MEILYHKFFRVNMGTKRIESSACIKKKNLMSLKQNISYSILFFVMNKFAKFKSSVLKNGNSRQMPRRARQ